MIYEMRKGRWVKTSEGILKTSEAPWCCLIGLLLEEKESDSEMFCGSCIAGACSQCLGLMWRAARLPRLLFLQHLLTGKCPWGWTHMLQGTGWHGHGLSTCLPCRRGEAWAMTKKSSWGQWPDAPRIGRQSSEEVLGLHKLHVLFFESPGMKVDGWGLFPDLQLASHCPSLFYWLWSILRSIPKLERDCTGRQLEVSGYREHKLWPWETSLSRTQEVETQPG